MEMIEVSMKLTPGQLFELSALVQKWQDHERGVVIKKEVPPRVLANYQKPEPKKNGCMAGSAKDDRRRYGSYPAGCRNDG